MELTQSYLVAVPQRILYCYDLRETRNAAAILDATSPGEFDDAMQILGEFWLSNDDLVFPGGNESEIAARLDGAFRVRGWREGRVDTRIISVLILEPHAPAGERRRVTKEREVCSEGYKVDNVKGRIALDVEWNAKDGNLDRDIGAYRALYDADLIDGAVLLTRTQDDLRALAVQLARDAGLPDEEARKRLATTTTTNLAKLEPRMTRGDAGGCPLLAVAISPRCWRPPG